MMLEVKDLSIGFDSADGIVQVLEAVNFSLDEGEIVGIVGESGSGKSVTALSILGLLGGNAIIDGGSIIYKGQNILSLTAKKLQPLRGKEIGMVFQEPMTALHPTMKIGRQLAEVIKRHQHISKKAAYQRAIEALDAVHIHYPEKVAGQYPYELSGGMRQRVVIALAMAGPPKLLLADEPTTALDVTIQKEILDLFRELNHANHVSILLITHDLGVVSQICDRTLVMYAGEIVEAGPTDEVLEHPSHPYTQALIDALPEDKDPDHPLNAIQGEVITLKNRPVGCCFASRCRHRMKLCDEKHPQFDEICPNHSVSCWMGRDE